MPTPFIRLSLRIQPGAKKNEITGWTSGPEGQDVLKVRLHAPAIEGKANAALLEFLTEAMGRLSLLVILFAVVLHVLLDAMEEVDARIFDGVEVAMLDHGADDAAEDFGIPFRGYAKTRVAGVTPQYVIGKALNSGVAGDFIEFAPVLPTPHGGFSLVAAGEGVVGSTSTAADVIAVAGMLATDIPVVQINTQGAAETIKTVVPAAGQINVGLSANATLNTTKYNYLVFRAINS
ncbi:MAG: DUF167 domain-containing protein [Methylacidiphilales bacterium]|nr:DUF167 domain-containing protein [Candidatus Methylacidiphilales bacterium]